MVTLGLSLVTLAWSPIVFAHSFLAEPAARNLVAKWEQKEYCPHCLQGGGPNTVKERGNGVWPTKDAPSSHGLCGDPVQGAAVAANWRDETYLTPSPVQRTYTAGEIVEFVVGVSTHHRGHYEFRICDQPLDGKTLTSREEGQACLDAWLLERAPRRESCQPNDSDPDCQPLDEAHPERWYLPPRGEGTPVSEAGLEAKRVPASDEVHKMRYKIPDDLRCSHCTLQWYWSTGNTCLYDGSYFQYFDKMRAAGWNADAWCNFCYAGATCEQSCCGINGKFGEEFWNCADVAVLAPGESEATTQSQTTTQSPATTETPTIAPLTDPATTTTTMARTTTSRSTSEPESEPETEPEEEDKPMTGGCSAVWGQCGGQQWKGATCCQVGSTCNETTIWYHQCVPSADPSTSDCAAVWGQCGGLKWIGATCCQLGSSCKVQSEWYHQCLPDSASLASVGQQKKFQRHQHLRASASATAMVQKWETGVHARLSDETEEL